MADYVNHQFECFIPEKAAEENLLILQPTLRMLGVSKIGRLCKVHYGEASNSILYSRRSQILKPLSKDPHKAKNILKEKNDLLQKSDQNLFGKKFRSHVAETERSRKQTLEVFSSGNRSAPSSAKKPFQAGPLPNSNKPYGGGRFYYDKKLNNRDRHNTQYRGKQNNRWSSGVSGKRSFASKTGSLVKILFTGKIPDLQLAEN